MGLPEGKQVPRANPWLTLALGEAERIAKAESSVPLRQTWSESMFAMELLS